MDDIPQIEDGDPGLNCPGLLRFALMELLYHTLLQIRGAASDRDFCFALSDHAHNIPHLVGNYKFELLKYYWEVERPCFLRALEHQNKQVPTPFQKWWMVVESEYWRLQGR
jgi:hypothetical protein